MGAIAALSICAVFAPKKWKSLSFSPVNTDRRFRKMNISKFIAIHAGFLFLVVASAIPSFADVLTFDEISLPGLYSSILISPDRYRSEGVILSTDGQSLHIGRDTIAHTPQNYLFATLSGANAESDIIVDFVLPNSNISAVTDWVSFHVVDYGAGNGGVWAASVYNADGELLDSLSSTEQLFKVEFNCENIRRLIFSPSDDYEGFDTLEFGELIPVAEPCTARLILMAIVTLLVVGTVKKGANY
jgi:hypothetical protein